MLTSSHQHAITRSSAGDELPRILINDLQVPGELRNKAAAMLQVLAHESKNRVLLVNEGIVPCLKLVIEDGRRGVLSSGHAAARDLSIARSSSNPMLDAQQASTNALSSMWQLVQAKGNREVFSDPGLITLLCSVVNGDRGKSCFTALGILSELTNIHDHITDKSKLVQSIKRVLTEDLEKSRLNALHLLHSLSADAEFQASIIQHEIVPLLRSMTNEYSRKRQALGARRETTLLAAPKKFEYTVGVLNNLANSKEHAVLMADDSIAEVLIRFVQPDRGKAVHSAETSALFTLMKLAQFDEIHEVIQAVDLASKLIPWMQIKSLFGLQAAVTVFLLLQPDTSLDDWSQQHGTIVEGKLPYEQNFERLLSLLKHKLMASSGNEDGRTPRSSVAGDLHEADVSNSKHFELWTITLALQRAAAHRQLKGVLKSPKYDLIPSILHVCDEHAQNLEAVSSAVAVLVNLVFEGDKADDSCLELLVMLSFVSVDVVTHSRLTTPCAGQMWWSQKFASHPTV